MMQIILFSLGVLIYIAVVLDLLQTTLSLQGGGWLTTWLSYWFWSISLKLSGKDGTSPVLGHTGFFLLVFIVFVWVFLLWFSFFLMLSSTWDSVIHSSTGFAAGLWDKVYYSGFTLSTLGVGDYTASTSFWRILTTIFSFSGLILLTMSVTYLIPALSAVMEQRKIGVNISRFGNDAQDMVLNSWDGEDFSRLFSEASTLADSLVMHSQQHRSYPVIQYFHNTEKQYATILQMARLYEALNILKNFVRKEIRPTDYELSILLLAYENYLQVIFDVSKINVNKDINPEIKLDKLIKSGLVSSTVEVKEFDDRVDFTRRVLYTLVNRDGWNWNDVYHQD